MVKFSLLSLLFTELKLAVLPACRSFGLVYSIGGFLALILSGMLIRAGLQLLCFELLAKRLNCWYKNYKLTCVNLRLPSKRLIL